MMPMMSCDLCHEELQNTVSLSIKYAINLIQFQTCPLYLERALIESVLQRG